MWQGNAKRLGRLCAHTFVHVSIIWCSTSSHGAVGQGRHRGWKRSAGLAGGSSGQLNGNNANKETPPTSALQCLVCLLWGPVETCSATQWTHAKVTEHTGDIVTFYNAL